MHFVISKIYVKFLSIVSKPVYYILTLLGHGTQISKDIYFVEVRPDEVTHISNFNGGYYLYKNGISGGHTGVWDYFKYDFRLNIIYIITKFIRSNQGSFVLKWYLNTNPINKIVLKQQKKLHSLSRAGYKSQYELNQLSDTCYICGLVLPRHEMFLAMDRNGRLFRLTSGRHRLAVAKVENLDKIYGILLIWHPKAKNKLPKNRRLITDNKDSFRPFK